MDALSRYRLLPLTFALLFGSLTSVVTASVDKRELDMILDFAESFCGEYFRIGSKDNLDLSGAAKIEIDAIFKKLVDAGIDGDAKLASENYFNVLREDLASEFSSNRDCREIIWRDLHYKLERGNLSGYKPDGKGLFFANKILESKGFLVESFGCKRVAVDSVECSFVVKNDTTKSHEVGIGAKNTGLNTAKNDTYKPNSIRRSNGKWESSRSTAMGKVNPGRKVKYDFDFLVSPDEKEFESIDIELVVRWARHANPVFTFD